MALNMQQYVHMELQQSQNCILAKKYFYICYKLVQGFSVTGLFTGQYSAKGYDTNTDDIGAHHIETRQIQYTRWTNKKS